MSARRAHRGAALITALLLAALAAVMVSGMMWGEWGAIQREQAARQSEQARWLLRGALDWARLILNEAAQHGQVVALDQPWAVPLAESDLTRFLAASGHSALGQAWLEGRIEDAQSRFNLTDLALFGTPYANAVQTLQRLCTAVGVDPSLAQTLAQAIVSARAAGSLDLPIFQLQDLARLSPAVAAALPRLAPVVTVLPQATPVNLNTAGPVVLAAVLDISTQQAAQLVAARTQHHFDNVQQVRDALKSNATTLPIDPVLAGVTSNYFEAVARVRIADFEYAERALVQRTGALSQTVRMQRVAPWLADPVPRD